MICQANKGKIAQVRFYITNSSKLPVQISHFGSNLRTAQNELENEPYMLGKLWMYIFWSILRIIKIIFLDEVMDILACKGQESTW